MHKYDVHMKDPTAVLDYGFDWSQWLDTGDTIAASSWTVPSGLTLASSGFTDTTTTVVLSGGTAGEEYVVTNRITTDAGLIDERSKSIRVVQR